MTIKFKDFRGNEIKLVKNSVFQGPLNPWHTRNSIVNGEKAPEGVNDGDIIIVEGSMAKVIMRVVNGEIELAL